MTIVLNIKIFDIQILFLLTKYTLFHRSHWEGVYDKEKEEEKKVLLILDNVHVS